MKKRNLLRPLMLGSAALLCVMAMNSCHYLCGPTTKDYVLTETGFPAEDDALGWMNYSTDSMMSKATRAQRYPKTVKTVTEFEAVGQKIYGRSTTYKKFPNKSRTETFVPYMTESVSVYNNGHVSYAEKISGLRTISGVELQQEEFDMLSDDPRSKLTSVFSAFEVVTPEEKKADYVVVKCSPDTQRWPALIHPQYYTIERKTMRVVEVEGIRIRENSEMPVKIILTKFACIDGIETAVEALVITDDNEKQLSTFISQEINIPLDDSLFDPPQDNF